MIRDNESTKGRKLGGPKANKTIMKQLAKNGLSFKEPNAGTLVPHTPRRERPS